jgi:membrane fusion protein (multidrug efflux system)
MMTTFRRFPLIAILCLSLMMAGCQQEETNPSANAQTPPVAVNVMTLTPQTVTLTRSLPARTVAYRKADIRPQVNGIIEQRLFEEGSQVEAGQQLYQIEPALYAAALANAEAELARARAALNTAKARESRYKNLLEDKAISRQDYDDALATYQQAQAEILVQQATVKTAQTNLGYTRMNAPISGRIGKSNVTEGALVTAQQAEVLATIHQLDPIYVDIAQPSKELLNLRKQMLAQKLTEQAAPTVTLQLEDGSLYPHEGKLQFAEVDVDPSTGDVVLRAIMPNPEQLLLPGMFVRASIAEGQRTEAILAPQKSISFNRDGSATAMVVNADNQVELRSLELEQAIAEYWLVSAGLQVGDRVIIAGLQKVTPGDQVQIDSETRQTSVEGMD